MIVVLPIPAVGLLPGPDAGGMPEGVFDILFFGLLLWAPSQGPMEEAWGLYDFAPIRASRGGLGRYPGIFFIPFYN